MRICLLTNQDLDDDNIAEDDFPCDPRPYLPDAKWKLAVLEKTNAVEQVIALSRGRFDVFFNLCDGSWDEEDNPGIEVVKTLEQLDVPFTGGTSGFYEPSREAMKKACQALDIDTPAYVMARNTADVKRAAEELNFPLFVKHPSSYASIGLTPNSKVNDLPALLEQARIMLKAYAGALIEEFIEGLECTVLVAENPNDPHDPIVYQPMQFKFPRGDTFKHSDLKWVSYEDLESHTVKNKKLDARLREVSAKFFLALNGTGYGRCDLRIDSKGRAFMLEINANCGLYFRPEDAGSADFVLQAAPGGHEAFTRLVIDAAIKRHARLSPAWQVRPLNGEQHALYARRPIRREQPILFSEGHPHRLVTLAHAEQHWSAQQVGVFRRTAWPLSDDLYAAWSQDPADWKPIRHSCDPNAWLDGLDVIARRRVTRGDEITLDYATFHNELMPEFECSCDAAECRGTIRGDDYLKDFVERYGDHVSDYVRSKRAARADSLNVEGPKPRTKKAPRRSKRRASSRG